VRIGIEARSLIIETSDTFSSAAMAAAALGIGERTLRRCWALMRYAKKSANHGKPAIEGQVLGTIEESAIQGNSVIGKPGKPVIVGRLSKPRARCKVPKIPRKH
jgi:hypothetical protein